MPPLSFRVIQFDTDLPASATNTAFGGDATQVGHASGGVDASHDDNSVHHQVDTHVDTHVDNHVF